MTLRDLSFFPTSLFIRTKWLQETPADCGRETTLPGMRYEDDLRPAQGLSPRAGLHDEAEVHRHTKGIWYIRKCATRFAQEEQLTLCHV